jgi:hypothetical protein
VSDAALHPKVDELLGAIDPTRGAGALIPQEALQRFSADIRDSDGDDLEFIEHLAVAATRIETAGMRRAAAQIRQLLELSLQRMSLAVDVARAAAAPRAQPMPENKVPSLRPGALGGVGMRGSGRPSRPSR